MVRLFFLVSTNWNQSDFHVIDIDHLVETSLVRKVLRRVALVFLMHKRLVLLYCGLYTFLIKQNLLCVVVQSIAWVSDSILRSHSLINLVHSSLSKGLSVHLITSLIIVLIPLVEIL